MRKCFSASTVARAMVTLMPPGGADSPAAALQPTVVLLHDALLFEPAAPPALQDSACRLCEAWWHSSLPLRESIAPKTLPFVLASALAHGRGADVKRCHALRQALELFDFDHPSIGFVQRLLLRAAFAPSFLRVVEGRRFVSFIFTLHPALVRELAPIFRNIIAYGRAAELDAVGEVLYRAWRANPRSHHYPGP